MAAALMAAEKAGMVEVDALAAATEVGRVRVAVVVAVTAGGRQAPRQHRQLGTIA